MKEIKDALENSRVTAAQDYVIDDRAGVVLPESGATMVDEDDWFDDAPAAGAENEDEPRESEERRLQRKRKEHATSVDLVKKRRYRVGQHHGRLNILPRDYTFTPMTPSQLVQNWLLGSERHNVPPLGLLDSKDVQHLRGGNKVLQKMKAVMRIGEDGSREACLD